MDSLCAGAAAGLVVDLSLFPIDTIKTRIQAKEGFWASGGLRHIYKGLSAVAIGSIPGGAAFFYSYDTTKKHLFRLFQIQPPVHNSGSLTAPGMVAQSLSASVGECSACCIRVPTEMVKQQLQAGKHSSAFKALCSITHNVSPGSAVNTVDWRGLPFLFRGMPIMLLREIPFSVCQMSLYESLKYMTYNNSSTHALYYSLLPLCGAVSGGIAAFLTTPLDVVKTRIMLHHGNVLSFRSVIQEMLSEPARHNDRFGTCQKFFRGATARVLWISLGGSVFFSTYEYCRLAFAKAKDG